MSLFFDHNYLKIIGFGLFALLAGAKSPALAQETNSPEHKPSALIISPLMGWVENENLDTGQTDRSPEYGLFAMYATPRFVVNNTAFFTDVSKSDVWGNITSLSLYGDPKARLTWFFGGSYTLHQVENEVVKVNIAEPIGKVGFVWRIPSVHISINPYVGYGLETVRTEVSTPFGTFKFRDRSDIAVYGVSAYWRWRMLYANAKYYLSDDLDHNTLNNNFRVWGTAMYSDHVGVLMRLEYTEQNTTKDTSVLFGPVFVF